MEIESPFPKEAESFNNTEFFPDLDFVVPGMDKPLQLHKKILAKASTRIKEILKNNKGKRLDWMFEVKNEVDKQALMKTLRFCYGEKMNVGTKNCECCGLIAAFSRLQVTCLDEVVAKLKHIALEVAKNDWCEGVRLLKMSMCYEECCKTNGCTLDKELARVVMTKENMIEHFKEVVDDCLMTLPSEYLDEAEYGSPHTECSEFCLRTRYMRIHSKEMSEEDKRVMISKCDLSTLSSQELKELRVTNLVDKDELLSLIHI